METSFGSQRSWLHTSKGTIRRRWKYAFVLLCLAYILHQPLPDQLCANSPSDRRILTVFEPLTRLFYFYPNKLCPSAYCMVAMTRFSLETLNYIVGPWHHIGDPVEQEPRVFNGVRVVLYRLRNQSEVEHDGVIVYIHGGGFVFGSPEMFDVVSRDLVTWTKARLVVSIDYRRAPETPFPGAVDDCEAAIDLLMTNGRQMFGIDPEKIIVSGDSAGGNLAAVMAQRFSFKEKPHKLLGQVLVYPVVQMSDMQTFSFRMQETYDGLALPDPHTAASFFLLYLGADLRAHPEYIEITMKNGHVSKRVKTVESERFNLSMLPERFRHDVDPRDENHTEHQLQQLADPVLTNPDFAPIMRKNLSGLPPALVLTAEFDILRDDGILYQMRLKGAGVPTTWIHYDHGFHTMINFHRHTDAGHKLLDDFAAWSRRRFESVP